MPIPEDDFDTRTRIDPRHTGDHPLRYMTRAGGYVMVRYARPFQPYVITEKAWLALPVYKRGRK